MSFDNHTSCHCVDETIVRQKKVIIPSIQQEPANDERLCPPKFIRVKNRFNDDSCDCIDGHTHCIRLKNGHEHFPMDSRL